jgi:hypothetical protein
MNEYDFRYELKLRDFQIHEQKEINKYLEDRLDRAEKWIGRLLFILEFLVPFTFLITYLLITTRG